MAYQDKDNGIESLVEIDQGNKLQKFANQTRRGRIHRIRKLNKSSIKASISSPKCRSTRCGRAGDSVLAVMATGLASGTPLMHTAALATCMASLAVTKWVIHLSDR